MPKADAGSDFNGGKTMIRTISLAILSAVALSGCISSGYAHRDGGVGDYYYGRSSQSYYGGGVPYSSVRYGSGPYGSVGYGYPGGVYGSIGYGYPSYYGGGAYRYGSPYSGYYGPYYPPYRPYVRPRHPHRHGGKRPHHGKRPDADNTGQAGPGSDEGIERRNLNRRYSGIRDPRAVPSRPQIMVQRPSTGMPAPAPARVAPPPRLERNAPPAQASRPMPRRPAPRRSARPGREIE